MAVEQVGRTVLASHATVAEAVAQRDDVRSYLVVVNAEEPVSRHAIGPEPLTVGRDQSRDIVLPDAQVSRLHLQVALIDGELVVEDLGSSNGTYYDGQRIASPVLLKEGHWVQLGSHLLKHERRSPRDIEREEDLRRDLDKARSYVRSLLPPPVASGPIRTDWCYRPSAQLGGDAFIYGALDDDHFFASLVDVSGHGVGAAMHSVSVLNVLRQRALPATDLRDPAAVLASLNLMFPMEAHDGMFFTIWYGVYARSRRELSYATAGHHAAYLRLGASELQPLRTRGPMIGAIPDVPFTAARTAIAPGSVLYVFSDGVFEVTRADGAQCGLEDFLPLLGADGAGTSGESARIFDAVRRRARRGPLDDDYSFLAVTFD
jgi:serine phosphatase RsbU (regulator of sigma subunit)